MGCCHYYAATEGGDTAFTVNPPVVTFGAGCLREVGDFAESIGLKRVALYTDAQLSGLEHVAQVKDSLVAMGIEVAVYDEVGVEPTDVSFAEATKFADGGEFDGFVSVGGGSVIDTCKAANLFSTYPASLLTYVNAPIGQGEAIPGPLKPHIACPTTAGTGSECTGIAIFDLLSMKVKTGIAGPHLRPTRAFVDPNCTLTLPPMVVSSCAFDILCHALESYTARPYTKRPAPGRPCQRPMSQGANPWSDMGCREALRLLGRSMVRGVNDSSDHEARSELMWAATLAGIAFGNAGVHIPHGMSYAVAGLVKSYRPADYPQEIPMVPHGMSVVLNAPSVFQMTAPMAPSRHLEGAQLLGADARDAGADDAGEVLAKQLISLMKQCFIPNGLSDIGYTEADIPGLTEGAFAQQRLLQNAPEAIDRAALSTMFAGAMKYW